jgi:hypothetical protein
MLGSDWRCVPSTILEYPFLTAFYPRSMQPRLTSCFARSMCSESRKAGGNHPCARVSWATSTELVAPSTPTCDSLRCLSGRSANPLLQLRPGVRPGCLVLVGTESGYSGEPHGTEKVTFYCHAYLQVPDPARISTHLGEPRRPDRDRDRCGSRRLVCPRWRHAYACSVLCRPGRHILAVQVRLQLLPYR